MTTKTKKKIGHRVINTKNGIRDGNIPEGATTLWMAFSSDSGKVRWEPTRSKLRSFIKKNPEYSSTRKAYVEPAR